MNELNDNLKVVALYDGWKVYGEIATYYKKYEAHGTI